MVAGSPSDAQPAQARGAHGHADLALCRSVVGRLRAAYGWALIEEEALMELVLAAAPPAPDAPVLEYLARDQYNRALWAACRQGADPARREQAYAELQRYLYRAAYNRRPTMAEECVQRALELVFTKIETCREPGAFLTFALAKLRQALREEADEAARVASAEEAPEQATPADATTADVEDRERAALLLAAIGRLRDTRQRATLVLKFFHSYDDQQIAARLEITPNHVRQLRHRALARLREDPDLAALVAAGP